MQLCAHAQSFHKALQVQAYFTKPTSNIMMTYDSDDLTFVLKRLQSPANSFNIFDYVTFCPPSLNPLLDSSSSMHPYAKNDIYIYIYNIQLYM